MALPKKAKEPANLLAILMSSQAGNAMEPDTLVHDLTPEQYGAQNAKLVALFKETRAMQVANLDGQIAQLQHRRDARQAELDTVGGETHRSIKAVSGKPDQATRTVSKRRTAKAPKGSERQDSDLAKKTEMVFKRVPEDGSEVSAAKIIQALTKSKRFNPKDRKESLVAQIVYQKLNYLRKKKLVVSIGKRGSMTWKRVTATAVASTPVQRTAPAAKAEPKAQITPTTTTVLEVPSAILAGQTVTKRLTPEQKMQVVANMFLTRGKLTRGQAIEIMVADPVFNSRGKDNLAVAQKLTPALQDLLDQGYLEINEQQHEYGLTKAGWSWVKACKDAPVELSAPVVSEKPSEVSTEGQEFELPSAILTGQPIKQRLKLEQRMLVIGNLLFTRGNLARKQIIEALQADPVVNPLHKGQQAIEQKLTVTLPEMLKRGYTERTESHGYALSRAGHDWIKACKNAPVESSQPAVSTKQPSKSGKVPTPTQEPEIEIPSLAEPPSAVLGSEVNGNYLKSDQKMMIVANLLSLTGKLKRSQILIVLMTDPLFNYSRKDQLSIGAKLTKTLEELAEKEYVTKTAESELELTEAGRNWLADKISALKAPASTAQYPNKANKSKPAGGQTPSSLKGPKSKAPAIVKPALLAATDPCDLIHRILLDVREGPKHVGLRKGLHVAVIRSKLRRVDKFGIPALSEDELISSVTAWLGELIQTGRAEDDGQGVYIGLNLKKKEVSNLEILRRKFSQVSDKDKLRILSGMLWWKREQLAVGLLLLESPQGMTAEAVAKAIASPKSGFSNEKLDKTQALAKAESTLNKPAFRSDRRGTYWFREGPVWDFTEFEHLLPVIDVGADAEDGETDDDDAEPDPEDLQD